MAPPRPGSSSTLVKDAHYHAVQATTLWAAFRAAMDKAARETAAERDRRDDRRTRATTYDRGTLGGH